MLDPTNSTTEALGRVFRAVALARVRLRSTWGGWFARVGGGVGALAFGAALVILRARGVAASGVSTSTVVLAAVRWLSWFVVAPLSLAASSDLRARDRDDGILTLALVRGLSARELDAARALAAMLECAWRVGLPLVIVAVLAAVTDKAPGSGLFWARATIATVVFATIFGLTLGGLASACGRLAGRHGPSLYVAVLVAPWLLAKGTELESASIPSALGAVLGLLFGTRTM